MNVNLMTFYDTRLKRSAQRLEKQGHEFSSIRNIILETQNDLETEFINKFSGKLCKTVRGFGYWSWKPQIILQNLQKIPDNEILVYVDVGFHLNIYGEKRFNEYLEIVSETVSGVLAFQSHLPSLNINKLEPPDMAINQFAGEWIKGDVFNHFEIYGDREIAKKQMIGAGLIFFRNCDNSRRIVQEWLSAFSDNFTLIDDTPSIVPSYPEFIEHRHDQSIFTIVGLLNNIHLLSAYEYFYPIRVTKPSAVWRSDWSKLQRHPFHAKKDLDYGDLRSKVKNILHKTQVKRKW